MSIQEKALALFQQEGVNEHNVHVLPAHTLRATAKRVLGKLIRSSTPDEINDLLANGGELVPMLAVGPTAHWRIDQRR